MSTTRSPLVVVMGVSGAGKTSVGSRLALALQLPFVDADDLHPLDNIRKMAAGVPLTDDDRRPWLLRVAATLLEHEVRGLVVACSTLRRSYRDAISHRVAQVQFIHLHGSFDMLQDRLEQRREHFMPGSLLASQLAALEPLESDERGVVLDVSDPLEHLVAAATEFLGIGR